MKLKAIAAKCNSLVALSNPRRRTQAGSIVDEVEPRIRELLQAYPRMPATVIAERVGWQRRLTVFEERVAELRPVYLPPDPAGRTSYVAGEIAQCDLWFPPIDLPVGFGQTRRPAQLPVLTMITGYSTLAVGDADPDAVGRGSVRRLVAADRGARRGAAGAGLGRRGRDRSLAGRQGRTHRRVSGLPRNTGRQGADL